MSQNENPLTPDQNQPNTRLEDDQYYQHLQTKERFAGMTYDQIEAQIKQDIINLRKTNNNLNLPVDQNVESVLVSEDSNDGRFIDEPDCDTKWNFNPKDPRRYLCPYAFGKKIPPELLAKISPELKAEIINDLFVKFRDNPSKGKFDKTLVCQLNKEIIEHIDGDTNEGLVFYELIQANQGSVVNGKFVGFSFGSFDHSIQLVEILKNAHLEIQKIELENKHAEILAANFIQDRLILLEAINVPEILSSNQFESVFENIRDLDIETNDYKNKVEITKLEIEIVAVIQQLERYAQNIQRLESQLDRDKNKTGLNLKYQNLKAAVFKKPNMAEQIDDNYETLESCQNNYNSIKERVSNLSFQALELLDSIQNPETQLK
jgi:hypothetical protein